MCFCSYVCVFVVCVCVFVVCVFKSVSVRVCSLCVWVGVAVVSSECCRLRLVFLMALVL